jgi:hypothetical protein
VDLVEVRERLEHEAVHAALEQPLRLRLEQLEGLDPRGLAERLEPDAERPDGAGDQGAGACRSARELGGAAVDRVRFVRQPVVAQLHRVGAERVGLEDLGSGLHVRLVNLLHQVGRLQVQLVVAHVDEDALRVQHRPHRAVEQVDAPVVDQAPQRALRHRGHSPGRATATAPSP